VNLTVSDPAARRLLLAAAAAGGVGVRRAGSGVLVDATLTGAPNASAAAAVAGALTGDRLSQQLATLNLRGNITVTRAAAYVPADQSTTPAVVTVGQKASCAPGAARAAWIGVAGLGLVVGMLWVHGLGSM
jgi:hypothetical protein